jgi:hypothetical protein
MDEFEVQDAFENDFGAEIRLLSSILLFFRRDWPG